MQPAQQTVAIGLHKRASGFSACKQTFAICPSIPTTAKLKGASHLSKSHMYVNDYVLLIENLIYLIELEVGRLVDGRREGELGCVEESWGVWSGNVRAHGWLVRGGVEGSGKG